MTIPSGPEGVTPAWFRAHLGWHVDAVDMVEIGEGIGVSSAVYRATLTGVDVPDGQISEETRDALKAELGDVLWYLSQVATELDLSLDEIAEYNIDKLMDRLERGKIRGDGDNR
jgi:NTP pyrophosphatase (non-canonical NTP hydrolase)